MIFNFHPLTYDQYSNVLGLHLPDDMLKATTIHFYETWMKGRYIYTSLVQVFYFWNILYFPLPDDEISVAEGK